MLQWFYALMPKEPRFFVLFEQHAAILTAGARALRAMLDGGNAVAERCAEVLRREKEADEVTRQVMLAVRSTFITPFDRGDIKDLITSMDDAIDQMQKTAKAITLFEVTDFTPEMRAVGNSIVACAGLVERAVPLLASMSKDSQELIDLCVQITRIEGEADDLHERGLKNLYLATQKESAMAFFMGNEIYDHLEKVVDRFDDVANQIQGVVIEHV
jgi:predicted phosphate transport protein (TIGR00153 family)